VPNEPGRNAVRVPEISSSARSGRKPPRQFKLAMRGYAPDEVEAFLARLSDVPGLPVPGFARVMRGYDPEQVDLHIQQVKALSQLPPA
jgi:DivIVA domain-containing protein